MNMADVGADVNIGKDVKCDECGDSIPECGIYYYSEWKLSNGQTHPTAWFIFCPSCLIKYRSS